MRRFMILALALIACKSEAELAETLGARQVDPMEVEKRVQAEVMARLAHEQTHGYLGCVQEVAEEAGPCLRTAMRRGEKRIKWMCATEAVKAKRICARIYKHTFSNVPDTSTPSDYSWVDDPVVPTTTVDCPEDLAGPNYIKNRRTHAIPAICIRNEVTGELW